MFLSSSWCVNNLTNKYERIILLLVFSYFCFIYIHMYTIYPQKLYKKSIKNAIKDEIIFWGVRSLKPNLPVYLKSCTQNRWWRLFGTFAEWPWFFGFWSTIYFGINLPIAYLFYNDLGPKLPYKLYPEYNSLKLSWIFNYLFFF